ncbi:MAG: single-stranded DNA-binding protein [Candidatus Paceibacterota bacterium]
MYLNKVYLIGNLTQDPEFKALPSGSSVTSFSLATNRTWTDKQGQRQETAEYHNIVSYGKQAETMNQYLKKGSLLFIEGRLQTRSWEAQDGQKKYKTEIIVDTFQFGPKGSGVGSTQNSQPRPMQTTNARPKPATHNVQQEELPTVNLDEDEIDLEEIPF